MADDIELDPVPHVGAMAEPEAITVDDLPAPPVLIDFRGDGSVPPHRMAPLVVGKSGKHLVLHPGINRVTVDAWRPFIGHPGLDALEESEALVVGFRLPRKINVDTPHGCLLGVIARTWSTEGLDALAEAEAGWYGDKPRKVITEALDKQRARLAKRHK